MINLNNYTLLALYATIFTWLITVLGSSMVFFFKKINKTIMDTSLGIAAGIMLSASFWSLLNPAIENARSLNQIPWLIVSIGFMFGGIFIFITDKYFQKKIKNISMKEKSVFLMILSITMHNIPEGLAVGIAFGSLKYQHLNTSLTNAFMLALAIGLQNFPEGSAISLPLRRENYTRLKSFIYGSLSAIVEPIFGVVGALLTIKIQYLMPIFLSFAAGAMIYVIIQELIPESQTNSNKSLMAIFTLIGFTIMMILDTAI
ncbi:MAG: ZIP family metal transporter [Bacilli bacterium]|nr:ZIP family metal transporter [Bacilli bacterium]